MASPDLQRLIAHAVASGERISDLARRFDYSERGMRKLVKTTSVQRLVAEEREALAQLAEQHRIRLVRLGEKAVGNVERVVEDPHHSKNIDTSRWVLDRTVFKRGDGPDFEVRVGPDPAIVAEIVRRLKAQAAREEERREPERTSRLIGPGNGSAGNR